MKNAVTQEAVENNITTVQYYQFLGTTVTVACITMKNGFTVIGESACADPDNFNAIMGEQIALVDAKRKMWSLLGFRIKDQLAENLYD